ncbi:FCSD flavin-binding domain-containing protein [Algihabitans albus]|uniref:FCSD flavin-binding domain-containing protein n=1 Tax=Algihabitans albus TaxID=2164067 RepID=UPI0035CF989B
MTRKSQVAVTRRRFTQLAAAAAATPLIAAPGIARGQAAAHVVVIGGGFGGATAAKYLKKGAPDLRVTLVEPNDSFITCPYSNLVLGGWRDLESITHRYDKLRDRWGIEHVREEATAIDAAARSVTLAGGDTLMYDRLIVSPGIDLRPPEDGGIAGYDEAAYEAMPHAWKPGAQTLLLRSQLEAMDDGGLFVLAAPPNPFRCPPGPYERVSMIADYFKKNKPNAKILVLDAKERFSKQGLFQQGWDLFYGDMIEWVSLADDGKVIEVDPATRTLITDFGMEHQADVANVVPPQYAKAVARNNGLADASGWCPVDGQTFESTLLPGIHVIGDASIASPMPKSGFAANSQGKTAAAAAIALLEGQELANPAWVNTCYSHVAPDYAISVAGVYKATDAGIISIEGSGGVSPMDANAADRKLKSVYADGWYNSITADMFS